MFLQFAQAYANSSSDSSGGTVGLIIQLAIAVVVLAGLWKLFVKAGQPGWAAIIPIYNVYILLKIAGKPGWWIILWLIPLVNIVASIIVGAEIGRRFGHSSAYGAILCGLLGIGYLLIGFGGSRYQAAPATV